MKDPDPPRLRLVPNRRRVKLDSTSFFKSNTGVQGTLFPEARSGMVIFVHVPDIEEREFEEVIRLSRPGCIVDLRLAPRFDLGRLNRAEAFRLFGDVQAAYIDATSPSVVGDNPEPGPECLTQLFSTLKFKFERPVLFLQGTAATSIASDEEIISLMMNEGKGAAEIVTVPMFQNDQDAAAI